MATESERRRAFYSLEGGRVKPDRRRRIFRSRHAGWLVVPRASVGMQRAGAEGSRVVRAGADVVQRITP